MLQKLEEGSIAAKQSVEDRACQQEYEPRCIGFGQPHAGKRDGQEERKHSRSQVAHAPVHGQCTALFGLRKPVGNLADPDREGSDAAAAENAKQEKKRVKIAREVIGIQSRDHREQAGHSHERES